MDVNEYKQAYDDDCYEIKSELFQEIFFISNRNELHTFISCELNFGREFMELYEQPNDYMILFGFIERLMPVSIVLENKYDDSAFTDSFRMCFAQKHTPISKYCKRLYIFTGHYKEDDSGVDFYSMKESFVGSLVIRPLESNRIGRSLLNARFFSKDYNAQLILTHYVIMINGVHLSVDAFPFSMQDTETTTCAENTIINMLDYFSKKYQKFRSVLPSEIEKIKKSIGIVCSTPLKGLKTEDMVRILSELGFSPRLFTNNAYNPVQLKRIMHYYLESGFPIALGIKQSNSRYHSITCIGHGAAKTALMTKKAYSINGKKLWVIDSADLYDDYYVMDDSVEPYKVVNWEQETETLTYSDNENVSLTNVVVPVDKQLFLEADEAFLYCVNTIMNLENIFGVKLNDQSEQFGTKESPVVLRFFMASRQLFKDKRIHFMKSYRDDAFPFYASGDYPSKVWVCEIYSVDSFMSDRQRAIGEIVLDPTATIKDKGKLILIRYRNLIYSPSHNSDYVYKLKNPCYIDAYNYNLQNPM